MNRITDATEGNGGIGRWSQTYSYDPWGNLQQSGTLSFGVAANTNNQIYDATHASWYVHDAAGNMTSRYDGSSVQTYTYDAEERMLTDGGYTYTYDAIGQRVKKGNGTLSTEYIYFGGTPIAEKDQSGAWTDYIFGGGKRIAKSTSTTSSSSVVYYHGDHLGSGRMMTDNSGTVVRAVTYMPFGSEASASGTDHYNFTGMEEDSETGFNHTLFRQQSPVMGRWMSPDPYMGSMDLTNPQSLNRYGYVMNNPMAWIDPDGLFARNPCYERGSDVNVCAEAFNLMYCLFSGNCGGPRTPLAAIPEAATQM